MAAPLYEHTVVLVGVDGSDESQAALELAASLAAATERDLVVVFVRHIAPFVEASPGLGEAMVALDDLAARVADDVKKTLAPLDRLTWRFEVRDGDPASALIEAADELGASLIVVGHHGHHQAMSLLLGSVASRLVHHAPQSVLVARSIPKD
jgi:nucleotide-binding universal stress UspA family protein